MAGTGPLAAQARPRLDAGARVRLTLAGPVERPPVIGRLVLLDLRTLTIVPRGRVRTRQLPYEALRRFEVSAGRSPWLMYGGLITGAAAGTLIGLSLRDDARCDRLPADDPACRWETAPVLVGAGGGLILSGIAVSLLVPERWRDVPLATLQASVAPAEGGVRLGFGIRF